MQVSSFNKAIQAQPGKQLNSRVKFASNNKEYKPDSIEQNTHGVPALASFFLPGLGQFLNGQTAKGIAHMASEFISDAIWIIGTTALLRDKKNAVSRTQAAIGGLGIIATRIISTVDAYREPNKK